MKVCKHTRGVATDQHTLLRATKAARETNGIVCPELMAGVHGLSTPWLPLIYASSKRPLLLYPSEGSSESHLGPFAPVGTYVRLLCSVVLLEGGTDLIMNGADKVFSTRVTAGPAHCRYEDTPVYAFDTLIRLFLHRTSSRALCTVVVGMRSSVKSAHPKMYGSYILQILVGRLLRPKPGPDLV